MKYARLSSKKRYISPGLIQAGVGVGGGLLTTAIQHAGQKKQQQRVLDQMWRAQELADIAELEDYNTKGIITEYLAKGGAIPSTSSTSTSTGKYATKGGNLKYIAPDVAVAEGNTHGEKTIDNSYGITLFDKEQGGVPVAEVEDEEVVLDDNYVFSDRLKADGKTSYAKKMKGLTQKRIKLENKLDDTTSARSRNTIERQLAGLNMAEEALIAKQEAHKLVEGEAELDKLAYGGGIGDPTNPPTPYVPSDKAKAAFDPSKEDFLPIRKIEKASESDGREYYKYFYDRVPEDVDYNEDLHLIKYTKEEHEAKSKPTSKEFSPRLKTYYGKTGAKISRDVGKLAYGGRVPDYVDTSLGQKSNNTSDVDIDPNTMKGNEVWSNLAPNLIDNVVNFGLTATSPNLAKPLMKKAANLKTNINVNPQLAAIERGVTSASDNIKANTSNSNIARANIAAVKLRGADAKSQVLGNKENTETQLQNQSKLNKQAVAGANTDTSNAYANSQFMRSNDIQARISGNVADISKNIKEAQTRKDQQDYVDEVMLLDLLDDPTGEKVRTMSRNPYFAKNPRLLQAILNEQKRKAKG